MNCSQCGKEIVDGQIFCPQCGFRIVPGTDEIPAVQTTGRHKTSWEDREAAGFFPGMVATIKAVLLKPADFFKGMPVSGGLTDPLLYGLIVGMAGMICLYFWDTVLHGVMTPELSAAGGPRVFQGAGLAGTAVAMPFMLILWLFAAAGFLHVILMLARGAKAGFEATFRVVAYSTSPFVFTLIPFCGMPITAVWAMTLAVIGLREAHGTTGGKAAFAVLFPVLFGCGILILFVLLFMGAVAASFGSLMQMYR